MKLNIITLLFFSFCIGQNTELFDKGNDLYNQGRYLEAIESYSDIIKVLQMTEDDGRSFGGRLLCIIDGLSQVNISA